MHSIKAVDLEISSGDFKEKYPELHHYTNSGGLRGILSTNNIWATHFRDLNDSTEITHLRQKLIDAITPEFDTIIAQARKAGQPRHAPALGTGGQFAHNFVNSLYGATFDGRSTITSIDAFISSFCSHSDTSPDGEKFDRSYERDNGLLSQWRGYGGGDGFCIVFDTAKLSDILAAEFDARYWVHMKIDPVYYALPAVRPLPTLCALVKAGAQALTDILDNNPSPEIGLQEFLSAASLFKHQGFREEQEVRVVAIPATEALRTAALRHWEFQDKPLPVVQAQPSRRRYVSLFDGLNFELPINRIIVGPSRHQEVNAVFVRKLLERDIPVTLSATPWRP